MTANELIEELKKLPGDLDVELLSNDGFDTRDLGSVDVETVKRGILLPTPKVYDIVVLSSGDEGL
jgi:hypothetical protein